MNELTPIIKATNKLIKDTDKIRREVAASMLAPTSDRIYNKGLAANGSQIGRYSKGYSKQRAKKGLSSGKVVLTFTGQMVNDFSVVQEGTEIGLGFKNSLNADKVDWTEGTYNKEIFAPTSDEEKQAFKVFENIVNRIYGSVIR